MIQSHDVHKCDMENELAEDEKNEASFETGSRTNNDSLQMPGNAA